MSTAKDNKNLTISAVRGIAIILVVLGHVIQRTMAASGADFFLNPAFKMIYTFHMPLFVFISGYLMAYSLNRRNVSEVFRAKCKGLLVPFVAWGILEALTFYLLNAVDGKAVNIFNFPWDALDQLLLHPSIWFLFTLFILSCLLLCSIKLQERLGKMIFVAAYFLILLLPYNDYCSLYYIKWFYLFFMAGYFINHAGIKITNKAAQKAAAFVLLIVFVVLASFWTKNDYIYINKMNFLPGQYFGEVLRLVYRYVVGFLGIGITFYIGACLAKTKAGRLLGYVGVYSLDIYLIQRYIVEGFYPRVAAKVHINFDFNSLFFLGFFAPLLSAFFIFLCILISQQLIRRSQVLNRLLLGGRI